MGNETIRFHYMDNLRAFAMVLGLFYHAALAYSPFMDSLWMAASTDNSQLLDWLAWLSHAFRMPLFFMVAGFFALMLLDKKGVRAFLVNRSTRLLLPLVVFLPLVLMAIVFSIKWALDSVENLSPMLIMIQGSMNNPDAAKPPITTMHLWFIYNLLLFCLAFVAIYLTGIFKPQTRLNQLLSKRVTPSVIVLLFPLIAFVGLYITGFPHPVPDRFMPALWSFLYYGSFFLLGAILFNQQHLIDRFKPLLAGLLIVSLLGYGYLYQQFPATLDMAAVMAQDFDAMRSDNHLWVCLVQAYMGIWLSLVLMVMAKTWFNRSNSVMRYISDSSYWVYILHVPVLFMVQFLLLDVQLNMWLEFFISAFGTWLLCLLSYTLLVRSTVVGTLLNGRRWAWFK